MIVILFTGGTIAMRNDPRGTGAIPALTATEILEATRGIHAVTGVETEEWGAFPGPHMTVDRMWALRNRIAEHLAREEVQGVVVTHGTDTLEETAYLVARSVAGDKPVVFTGAMRTVSDLGWDGPANLLEAVQVAASPETRGYGVMVVISGQIFAGIDATKTNTHLLDAFESPGFGPLGVLDEGELILHRELPPAPPIVAPSALATPVDIIFVAAGCDARLLDASRSVARGVVIAAMGRGNVPPQMVPAIERWIAEGKPVVLTSRTQGGRVGHTYGYAGGGRRLEELGVMFGGSRRAQQARIDLMLGLGADMPVDEIRAMLMDH
ncbi:MAG TPA: asparaginase [Gemmatimonadaceae bacterium]|nr:asparaginase [Gemmatimonadaceae bacterium]